MSARKISRPEWRAALAAWQACLQTHGLPEEALWVFTENVCIEHSHTVRGGLRIGFQTRFTPPDDDAVEIAFDHFCETGARVVFYRLGSAQGRSVCMLLCDSWFEEKSAAEGYERRDEWGVSFRPGYPGEIEEITELPRWVRRVRKDRAFHDFDFGMSLETIDELKLHGRTLLPYERMAQRMLGRLQRILRQAE